MPIGTPPEAKKPFRTSQKIGIGFKSIDKDELEDFPKGLNFLEDLYQCPFYFMTYTGRPYYGSLFSKYETMDQFKSSPLRN